MTQTEKTGKDKIHVMALHFTDAEWMKLKDEKLKQKERTGRQPRWKDMMLANIQKEDN